MKEKKISNASCFSCGFTFSDNTVSYLLSFGNRVRCGCGEWNTIDDVTLGFIHGAKIRSTPQGARERTWWHATLVEDWFHKVTQSEVDVHIGQKGAACDRLKSFLEEDWIEQYEEFTGFHLWTVKFSKDAKISDGIKDDQTNSWGLTGGVASIYLNRWESPGSVSVYTPSTSLRVVSHRMVKKSELYLVPSLYNTEPVVSLEI